MVALEVEYLCHAGADLIVDIPSLSWAMHRQPLRYAAAKECNPTNPDG
jgi:hypothetical protein